MNSFRVFNRALTYSRLSRPVINNVMQIRQLSYNNQNKTNCRSFIHGIGLISGLGLVLYNIKEYKPYLCDSNKINNKFILNKRDLSKLLSASCESGDINLVKLLIERGADVKANDNEAIRLASQNGHLEIVKLLIDHGADVEAQDNYAIRYASSNGHLEVVKLLIEHGADVKAQENWAIDHASYKGHLEVVKLLIEHGADPTVGLDGKKECRDFILDFIKQNLKNNNK